LTTAHHFLQNQPRTLEDGNGEIWMCLYFPKPFVPSLAELAVFKFVPHPYCQQ